MTISLSHKLHIRSSGSYSVSLSIIGGGQDSPRFVSSERGSKSSSSSSWGTILALGGSEPHLVGPSSEDSLLPELESSSSSPHGEHDLGVALPTFRTNELRSRS